MKIAFFAYAWGPGGRLDGYMHEMVEAFAGLGFDVDLYPGNYVGADGTVTGLKGDIDVARLAAYIREQAYVAAVSTALNSLWAHGTKGTLEKYLAGQAL